MVYITEIQGDLFSAPQDFALAHCVSEDLSMSRGIAKVRFYIILKMLQTFHILDF